MKNLSDIIMAYAIKRGYLPGEDLHELIDSLVESVSENEIEEALTKLIEDGKLRVSIRKGQFLHLRPTLV